MIIQLRRRHYYTWLVLAILLPVGFIWAYFNRPEFRIDEFRKATLTAYPNIIQNKETLSLKVNLRQNTDGLYQIELIVLKPLVGAANQLYLSMQPDKPLQILLGALDNRGTYYFTLPSTVTSVHNLTLTIYDVIKQKKVEQIIFKQ